MEAFDTWAAQAQLPNTQPLKDIGHPTEPPFIGVDARHFLEQVYWPHIEEWPAALGGFPLAFETQIIAAIDDIESSGCKLHFVFNGLQTNFDEPPFDNHISDTVARAFKAYGQKDVEQARELFTSAGFPEMNSLCTVFKTILGKHEKPFTVAPFKAHAQLVYALQQGAVDALYGSSELFLYGAPKVITKIRIQPKTSDAQSDDTDGQSESKASVEVSRIVWLELDQCLKMLGDISFELFQNALLLTGTKDLEAFPPLRDSLDSLPFKEVVAQLSQMHGNIFHYCERYPSGIRGDWLDRYMRTHQAIKHMVIMFDYETVKPRTYLIEDEVGRIPMDIHELVGLQLPAELHHYLYHGMISSRVLDWLISGKIKLLAPLAGGGNEVYRRLVREQLDPWRKQALALIAFSLSRYYQRKEFITQFWYGTEYDQKFSISDLASEKQAISGWRVKDTELNEQLKIVQAKESHASLGSLQFAISSIADTNFVLKTIFPARRPGSEVQLQSIEEISCNVLWRFLQIRGYINKEHQLTNWGRFLQSALREVGDSAEQAESVFLIVELLRLDLLDKASDFQNPGEAPKWGEDSDLRNCLLISSIACTGRLLHEPKQYRGPLNHNHLAYNSLVKEIRLALRDLIDMILATMFLDDEIERIRDDHLKIAAALPFRDHWSAGLAILSTYFLDEVTAAGMSKDDSQYKDNPNEPGDVLGMIVREMSRTKVKDSLEAVAGLWDAFITAAKSAPADIMSNEDKKAWSEVDEWYQARRVHIDD